MRPAKLRIDPSEAELWVRRRYGFEASALPMPGEVESNLLLSAEDGRRWVLKLSPTSWSEAMIECQLQVLEYLATSEVGRLVPRPVADVQGRLASRVCTKAGERGFLRLLTYLPGEPLVNVDRRSRQLDRQIGEALGKLDRTLSAFDHPGAYRRHFWDLVHLLEFRSLLDSMPAVRRRLVAAGLDRFGQRVVPHLGDLSRSVIHNDANDYNLLVQDRIGGFELTGIIDFGDMVHTITVAEPAIACAYAMLGRQDPWSVAAEITAGYDSVRRLSDLERTVLPDLVIGRLCQSLLLSAEAGVRFPEDPYLRVSERPVAELLETLLE